MLITPTLTDTILMANIRGFGIEQQRIASFQIAALGQLA